MKAGAKVTLLVRQASVETLKNAPLQITGALGEHVFQKGSIEVEDAAEPSTGARRADMLIVTTKVYDLRNALKPFASGGVCPPVLLLQNGMGSAEIATDVLGDGVPIYSSAMMIGMARTVPMAMHIAGQAGPIKCGALLGHSEGPLEAVLKCAELGFVLMEQDTKIRETVAFKLPFNSCMNPTGALTGLTYAELLKDDFSRQVLAGLGDETLAVFDQAFDYQPATCGQQYVEDILTAIVVPKAENHSSSMSQDLQAGRKTEIDFLNGYILAQANRLGLPAVRHQTTHALVSAREAS